jgi:hypothetical protein
MHRLGGNERPEALDLGPIVGHGLVELVLVRRRLFGRRNLGEAYLVRETRLLWKMKLVFVSDRCSAITTNILLWTGTQKISAGSSKHCGGRDLEGCRGHTGC